MAAIMTWFCKATPAGVFAVCPFLLFWLAMCPKRAHAHGRPLPPSCAAVFFFAGKRPRGCAHTRGVFSAGVFLRCRRSCALCAAHTQAERGRTARRCCTHALPRPHGRRRIVPCYGKPHSGHRSAHSGVKSRRTFTATPAAGGRTVPTGARQGGQ